MRCIKGAFICAKVLLCFSLWSASLFGAVLIEGDASEDATESFTFPLGPHTIGCNSFYVGADPSGVVDTNEYALSLLMNNERKFLPLAFQTAFLNGEDKPNPLFNKKIQYLSLIELAEKRGNRAIYSQHPVVVPNNDLQKIYVLHPPFNHVEKISMVSATNIKDAAGKNTLGIVGMAAGLNCVFAAVKPGEKEPPIPPDPKFGDPGSGIAFLVYTDKVTGEGEEKKVEKTLGHTNTFPLDISSELVKMTGGGDVSALSLADMYWDPNTSCLYLALQVKAGVDGARALVAGHIQNNDVFVLKRIAPDTVFTENNEIVGTGQGAANVSLHKIRIMRASTWLYYAIVVGGNGAPDDTQKKVFALPLVNDPTSVNHGTLAKFDSDPEDFFLGDPNVHAAFNNRFFKTPATQNADVLKANDTAALVGCGDAPGNIVDIRVLGDAVFVAVEVAFTAGVTKRRVFVSRTLFDNKGRVKAWTEWKPVRATVGTIAGFGFDTSIGSLISMENDTGVAGAVKSVRRTAWGAGDGNGLGDLSAVLSEELPQPFGGIHGLFDFSENYRGVSNAAFLIATGLKKVALIETGRGDPMSVNKGNFSDNLVTFDGGVVTQNLGGNLRVTTIGGGALDDIGPIESAEIAYADNSTRIFVGGPGGLAVLANPDGSGIVTPGLQVGFAGIVAGMSFAKIGEYHFVRKLVADGNFLYVLTDTRLDKIDLTNNNFNATTIATLQSVGASAGGSFLDLVVSGKFAVLATSIGIFRTGNGADVSMALSPTSVGWTKIAIPEVHGPVQALIPLAKNGLAQGLVQGGNLYVLSSYIGKYRAKWSRFEVNDVSAAPVDDNTFRPLPDIFVQTLQEGEIMSYFLGFGEFRKLLTTDGGLRFAAQDRDQEQNPILELISPWLFSGVFFASVGSRAVNIAAAEGASDIVRVVRSSASGDVLVGLDAGLQVNE